MVLSIEQRRVLGAVGGYTTRSRHDPLTYTATARSTFLASFETQVDPDGALAPAERAARAEAARKAHMRRLSLRSAEARRRRAGAAGSEGPP
jgi:hypothetical protein